MFSSHDSGIIGQNVYLQRARSQFSNRIVKCFAKDDETAAIPPHAIDFNPAADLFVYVVSRPKLNLHAPGYHWFVSGLGRLKTRTRERR
jgi:predicted polyphosphate/ATP-dependent NAD kinase